MAIAPRRHVQDNQIYSPVLPAARIQVDPALTYVGGPSFILYGVAHAEQHLFVGADREQAIIRLVWVQFEGYLPDNRYSYNYPTSETIDLGPYAFLHDAHLLDVAHAIGQRPDSDLAHASAFLQGRGYRLGAEAISKRFVHLIGDDPRDELMIIYLEDLTATGFHVTDLDAGGAAEQWPALAQALHIRALGSFSILPL